MNIFFKLNFSLSFVNNQDFLGRLRSLMKSAMQMKSLRDEILSDEIIASQWFFPLGKWLAQVDSNHRPRAYQARALTT